MSEDFGRGAGPQPPERRLPPPPGYVPAGMADRMLRTVEQRPLLAALVILLFLVLVHLLVLNIAGTAQGIYVGDTVFLFSGTTAVEILMLAFTAYSIVLPTLVSHACLAAWDELRPALDCDDRTFAATRAGLANPHVFVRLSAALLWAFLLTPVFGPLFRAEGEAWGAALLTIWIYLRIALTFGLLGSAIAYVVMLQHRFRIATASMLRVDLFDLRPLLPVGRYARTLALDLLVLLALSGPALSFPEAVYASASMLALGVVLAGLTVGAALWGARRAVQQAKRTALAELEVYARELWRRAYSGGHVAEAVALPAMGAILTVRNEIARLSPWPGGWALFARIAVLVAIPALSWFGGQIAGWLLALMSG